LENKGVKKSGTSIPLFLWYVGKRLLLDELQCFRSIVFRNTDKINTLREIGSIDGQIGVCVNFLRSYDLAQTIVNRVAVRQIFIGVDRNKAVCWVRRQIHSL